MKQILAVAAREYAERKLVNAAGAVLAVLTLLMPLLPGVAGFSRGDIIGVASMWVSAVVLFVGALIMGISAINGDLSDHRLGFYFSRPMPGLSIWIGKVVGTLAVIVVTALITFLPSAFAGFRSLGDIEAIGWALLAWGFLGSFFFGHIVACFARIRSAWLLLDFAGVFIVVVSAVAFFELYFRLLPLGDIGEFVVTTSEYFFRGAILVAVLASLSGLLLGRVDPPRVHRWTSTTLWSILFAVIAGAWGVSGWVASATPVDIRHDDRRVYLGRGDGEWMTLSGPARAGLTREFLVKDSEHFLPLGSRTLLFQSASRAIALQPTPAYRFGPDRTQAIGTVVLADLEKGEGWKETKIEFAMTRMWGDEPVVSPSGDRLAIRTETGIAVYSLPDERLIKAVTLEYNPHDHWSFLDERRLLVIRRSVIRRGGGGHVGFKMEFVEIDVETGGQERCASFEAEDYSLGPSHRVALAKLGTEWRLIDIRSGATIGSFEARGSVYSTRWLSNGALAIRDTPIGDLSSLRIMSRDGNEIRRIEIPAGEVLSLGYEARPDVLVVSAGALNRCEERRLLEIHIQTGETREVARGLRPLWSWGGRVRPSSAAARTFVACDRQVVRYDANLETSEMILE